MQYKNMRIWETTSKNLSIVSAMKGVSSIQLIENLVNQEMADMGLCTQAFCVEFFHEDNDGIMQKSSLVIECRDKLEASAASQCFINTLFDGAITGKVITCEPPQSRSIEFTTPLTNKSFQIYYSNE